LNSKTTVVRVSSATKRILNEMASAEGRPMTEVIAEAVEQYRRRSMLEAINESFARLESDEGARADMERDLAPWDATLADGLADES